ncbi:MAG: peptidoglycan DD-metalloendopeptidase family protein [Acutalibacteraceae bacterium]|nr:peptidoglycan DD-metalloendopeptidase family protein [Acutalibacteraceae bacterium]
MDKENKKVNNAENTKAQKPSDIDEVTDGFYDLSKLYGTPVKKSTQRRAQELKKRDDARRALEMQAIREDIERRYSLQLETAQSNTSPEKEKKAAPKSNIMPEIDERETVKEELERIDMLINSDKIVETPEAVAEEESKQEKKPRKKEPDFDISEANPVYAAFYSFGDMIYKILSVIFSVIFKIIKIPVLYIFHSISHATENTKRNVIKTVKGTVRESINFRREIKRALKSIKHAFKKPLTLPSVIFHYVKQAFIRHSGLIKTGINLLMPLGAFAVLLITINYWNNATFALEVIYNDQSIGYISDEAVYIEAKELVKNKLSTGAYSSDKTSIDPAPASSSSDLRASYNLSIVSVDKLNDARAISDKIIENSVDNLTHACGIYVDGEFICAVKNESDAKTVFYDILEPYESDAEQNGYVVGFAETIDYVQGLYRDDESVMWDASQLAELLTGEDRLVRIRKIVTSTSVRDIEYDTIKKRDASKYSGYRDVIQKGVNGSERVTKTQIYIDGELDTTEYSYETIIEPIDEIVTVGTKTTYGGVYIGEASDKGFLWPAPSCHSVSSPYGWRSSGWHNGIDLIRGGGGALGTPVIASQSGRVEVVQRSSSGYGNMVLINHGNGYKTRYAHMVKGSITVSVGDYVDAGQTIGKVGSTGNSTGPHLHFEVIYKGETQNPKNYIY